LRGLASLLVARDTQRPFVLPEGAVEVLLARHGSVEHRPSDRLDEATGVIGGHSDPDLSELGRRQALALTERLRDVTMRALFVTPLARTRQTAAPLVAELGLEPLVEPNLREVYLGDWEGQFERRPDQADVVRQMLKLGRWDVIPNAEPMEQLSQRVNDGLERVAAAGAGGGTVVAVVHGGIVAEACRQVTGSRPFAFLHAENASITRLVRVVSGRWELHGFNDVSHLADVAAPA
jgi:2,3-bisphosphoglycerate-dependent phosphoglycerate mutase